MTDTEFRDWLASGSAIRRIFIQVDVLVGVTPVTKYLSNTPYLSSDALIEYDPCLPGSINITESMNLEGSGVSMSFGDIEISNPNGEYDSWLTEVWVNRPIRVYIGDPRWVHTDFRLYFKGTVADLDSSSSDRLTIKLRDDLEKLNGAVIETKLGNYFHGGIVSTVEYDNANKDSLLPLVFGEVHNITPLLIDPTMVEYQVHNTSIEQIIEVRDNGVPVTITADLATGKFKLNRAAVGSITCSVQGAKGYTSLGYPTSYQNTIASIITKIVVEYGKEDSRLSLADIDSANFAAFNASNPQPVGVFVPDRVNVLDLCAQLASSVGATISMSRLGLLRLLQIQIPTSASFDIDESDYVENSLEISWSSTIAASIKLGYCRNYTTQTGLITGIPDEHKDLFTKEWMDVVEVDNTVKTQYKLTGEPERIETALQAKSDAETEAQRRLNIYKQHRRIIRFTGISRLFELELGQAVRLTSSRFGLSGGVFGQVVSLAPNISTGLIEVGVLI